MPVNWTKIYQSILTSKKGYRPTDLWDITMSDYMTILQPMDEDSIDLTAVNEVIEFDKLTIEEKVKKLGGNNV